MSETTEEFEKWWKQFRPPGIENLPEDEDPLSLIKSLCYSAWEAGRVSNNDETREIHSSSR